MALYSGIEYDIIKLLKVYSTIDQHPLIYLDNIHLKKILLITLFILQNVGFKRS
jgi:hypothetical protein